MQAGAEVVVVKQDIHGQETWRYPGRVLAAGSSWVQIEARFNRPDTPFHGILLGHDDRFVEWYYTDRYYNIDAIHARDDDHLRGWYCNVTRPAFVSPGQIAYVDLALDLLVYPDGRQLVLDEDEFDRLPLDAAERARARQALAELQAMFAKHRQSGINEE